MPRFWLDANVLIESHNRSYPIGTAVTFWARLAEQVQVGNVCCPRRVFKEVAEQDNHQDEVAAWMRNRRDQGLCISPTPEVQELVGRIEHHLFSTPQFYFAESWQFCKGGDPWVIAHASIDTGVVVTLETALRPDAHKPRIPDICKAFEVKYVDTLGMFKELKVTF